MQMRQGDVFFEKIQKIPEGLTKVKRDSQSRIVVAEGEATGHAHAISDPNVVCFVDKNGDMFLEVGKQPEGQTTAVAVQHEEHGTLNLEPGIWKASRQREYTPEAIRRVAD